MKKSVFFYILVLFSFSLTAAEKTEKKDYLSMRITPEVGLLDGVVKEYVFDPLCKNTDNVESRLDWDVYEIILFKIAGDFDILDYIFTGVNFSIGVPDLSGYMQDYDWLNSLGGYNGIPDDWKYDPADEYSNYSCHTNKLEKYLTFSVALGGNIPLPANIKVTPFVAYSYDYIGFIGIDGYTTYKSNDWRLKFLDGKVITYKQETNAFMTGARVEVKSIPRTYLYSDFSFSPALTFTNAMDYHHLTSAVYWDKFTNIWQIQANMRAQYSFNKNHSAGLSGAIQYMPRQKGITSTKNLTKEGVIERGKWNVLKENGGLERFLWSVCLSYSFSL